MNYPQVQWSQNLLADQIPSTEEQGSKLQIPTLSIKEDLIDKILNALNEFEDETIQDATTNFKDLITKIKEKPNMTIFQIITEIFETIGKTLLEVTGNAFQAVFDIAKAVIEEAWNIINKDIELGWLSRVYKRITGSKEFTILDIMCFVVAAPTTIITKAIQPKAVDIMPESEVYIIEKYALDQNKSLEDMIKELTIQMKKDNELVKVVITTILSVASLVLGLILFHQTAGALMYNFLAGEGLTVFFTFVAIFYLVLTFLNGVMNIIISIWNFVDDNRSSNEAGLAFVVIYAIGSTILSIFGVIASKVPKISMIVGLVLVFFEGASFVASMAQLIYSLVTDNDPILIYETTMQFVHNIAASIYGMSGGIGAAIPGPVTEPTLIASAIIVSAVFAVTGIVTYTIFFTRILYSLTGEIQSATYR